MASLWHNPIVRSVALIVFGALFHHLWNRYRNRLKSLVWSAWYYKVAVAGEDPRLGKVVVLYNDEPVVNVHTAFVQLRNESNADLQELDVVIACLEGSQIFGSFGYVEGSLETVFFSPAYLEGLKNMRPEQLDYYLSRVSYRIPVANRGARVSFSLLLRRGDIVQPVVTLSCVHHGVQLKHRPPVPMLFGVPQYNATAVGLLATLVLVLLLLTWVKSPWPAAAAAWVLGVTCAVAGVAVLKLWAWTLRIFE